MSNVPSGTPRVTIQIDRLLESAVILSWKDLLDPLQRGLIHIEHASVPPLQYLKIWQLTARGMWNLVCEYWKGVNPPANSLDGMMFKNDYHSAGLAGMLEFIMQHQESFAASILVQRASLIQVTPPTEQERIAASDYMKHAYESFGLNFAHIPAAALA